MLTISWRKILRHITGISCPLFGVSWVIPDGEDEIAQKLINILGNKRVLFGKPECENIGAMIDSVNELREILTNTMNNTNINTQAFKDSLSAMRCSILRFLDYIEPIMATYDDKYIFFHNLLSHEQQLCGIVLGELRASFGREIAQIVLIYKIEVEEHLAKLMPLDDKVEKIKLEKDD
jgi:hypothetical protein